MRETANTKKCQRKKRKGPSRSAKKERYWRQAIENHEKSGLTIRMFCQANGIAEHQFYAWRREILQRDRDLRNNSRQAVNQKANLPESVVEPLPRKSSRNAQCQEKQPKDQVSMISIADENVPPVQEESGRCSESVLLEADRTSADCAVFRNPPIEIVLEDITLRVPMDASKESLNMILSAVR